MSDVRYISDIGVLYYGITRFINERNNMRTLRSKLMNTKDNRRKYIFNDKSFDNINNQDKAYWLGFIMGDGFVSDDIMAVEISRKDEQHLEKLIIFMGGNNKITYTSKNCCVVRFCSRYLVNALKKYGVVKNKTYKKILTPDIPNKFIRHFYRGLYDSDGWITEHKSKRGVSQFEFGFSSYYPDILLEIQGWLVDKGCKSKGYILTRKRRKEQVSQFIIGGTINFQKIYNVFYRNTETYLDRKYIKATNFYNIISQRIHGREL